MANATIKRAQVYVDSLKVGEIENATLTVNNNNERMDGAEGVVGISDGNQHGDIEARVIHPTPGTVATNKLLDLLMNQAYCSIAFYFQGQQIVAKYKVNQARFETDSRSGTLRGTFNFMNGGPVELI